MLIVVGGSINCTNSSCSSNNNNVTTTDTVEIYDLTSLSTTWVNTTNFPHSISGTRGVTLNNTFHVTGRSIYYIIQYFFLFFPLNV